MSSWSRLENGVITAGEGTMRILPKGYVANNTKMGVIYCHGYGGNATEPRDGALRGGLYNIINAIAETNPVLSFDAGGDLWGNDTAVARMTLAVNYLQGTLGAAPGKIAIVGQSMGHTLATAWAAANPTKVAAIVANIPVCDMTDIITQSAYTASINSAYGGAYSDTTHGPTHNPIRMAQAGKLANIPWRGYSIADDTVATYSKVQAMQTALGSSASLVTLPGTGGHSWTTVSKIDPQDVLTFLRNNGL